MTYRKPRPSVCEVRISTDLALHPDLAKNPDKFAFDHHIEMAGCILPETSFKADRDTGGKYEEKKANITIGSNEAIRLFLHDAGDGYRLCSISVEPLKLFHAHAMNDSVSPPCLVTALDLVKSQVAPLLVNPEDADHIVPGHAKHDARSYVSHVKICALMPGIEIRCLHHLSHPLTGPAQGSTDKRITLCSSDDEFEILLEKESWDEPVGDRLCYTEGILVTLTLTGKTLVDHFSGLGSAKRVQGEKRFVEVCIFDSYFVFDALMAQLTGTYLPVPPEWAGMGKAVTPAKTMALLAEITNIPVDEIRAMDEAIRKPSKSTLERLDVDVAAAAACLKPIPVSRLFGH